MKVYIVYGYIEDDLEYEWIVGVYLNKENAEERKTRALCRNREIKKFWKKNYKVIDLEDNRLKNEYDKNGYLSLCNSYTTVYYTVVEFIVEDYKEGGE